MRQIFGIGETVLDVIFKNGQPQAAKPGGSVLNAMVSLGRMGLPVRFISEYAQDNVGELIDGFLSENGVDTRGVYRFSDGKTILAMAFLNERNDASYTFYRDFPQERLKIALPEISRDDLILCGSIFSITPEVRSQFLSFIALARQAGAIILYDPNFRKSHLADLERLRPFILENMQMADVVRGSDEDFQTIFGASGADEAYEAVRPLCGCMVYTANAKGVTVRTPSFSGHFPVEQIEPVSTIGAGDNFNAGMAAALYLDHIEKDRLTSLSGDEWSRIMQRAAGFAAEVCMSYENYISRDYALKIKNLYP